MFVCKRVCKCGSVRVRVRALARPRVLEREGRGEKGRDTRPTSEARGVITIQIYVSIQKRLPALLRKWRNEDCQRQHAVVMGHARLRGRTHTAACLHVDAARQRAAECACAHARTCVCICACAHAYVRAGVRMRACAFELSVRAR
eukprot:137686-Pleurochrysis_carterae.AAC.1